jgi:hypothetical protein
MLRSTRFAFAFVAFTLVALASLAAAPAALAQCDLGRWTAPVACQPVLSLPGGGTVDGDTLHLPRGQQVELHVQALDQSGRRFPQERFRFELDFERACNGLVELISASEGVLTLRTGDRAGSCAASFWLPNNMNLDRDLRFVVGRTATSGAGSAPVVGTIDTREELIAASLFRGLLAREPDGDWLAAAAAQVRQGDTRAVTRSILASAEFTQRRGTAPPEELLRQIYLGLLGREPDVGAIRTYSDEIRDGRYEELIDILLRSSELEQRLAREVG